jgi:N6-L-threonylcarbamoyladenine synthase
MLPMIEQALSEAELTTKDLKAVAATAGPGLLGSLLVGLASAKALAHSLNIPFIAIDHLEAHSIAAFLEKNDLSFPNLTLLISGGHTLLFYQEELGKIEIIGKTLDDAVGEAYDKISTKLELGYPGGPVIDQLSADYRGDFFDLPVPMKRSADLNFSFSGLKTAVVYKINSTKNVDSSFKSKLAASFQRSAIDALTIKLKLAIAAYPNTKNIIVCGGVACNKGLRRELESASWVDQQKLRIPPANYCTDNAAMVGYLAMCYFNRQQLSDLDTKPYTSANLSPVFCQ